MRIPKVVWITVVVAVQLVVGSRQAARADEGQAAVAMRIALQREASAREAYLAYAATAEAEHCAQAAALFRALAAAESVHANNFTIAMEHMGITPVIAPEPVTVGTTADNLQAAIEAEEFERRVASPKFMEYAAEECLYDALAALRYARDAATSHVVRLSLALAKLEGAAPGPTGTAAEDREDAGDIALRVCLGCGRVRTELLARHCDCGTVSTRCALFEVAGPERPPALIAGRDAAGTCDHSRTSAPGL
jgi:rubrerythrin